MFQAARYISIVIFLSLFALCIARFVWVRPSDVENYKKLLEESKAHSTVRALPTAAHQIRTKVSKEVWFTQEDRSRLQYRIHSESSLLTLEPKEKKIHVVENLNMVRCWMQDKLYKAANTGEEMQQLRFWEADHGLYRYTTQELLAQDVKISLFRLEGHTLPLNCDPNIAFLKGIANNVSFSITGKTPQFQANQFQATLTRAQ